MLKAMRSAERLSWYRRSVAGVGVYRSFVVVVALLAGLQVGLAQTAPKPAAQVTVDAPSSLPGSVEGSVVDADDRPIAHAYVKLQPAHGDAMVSSTDEDGGFRFEGVSPGTFTVTASTPGLGTEVVSDELPAAGHLELPELALRTATATFEVNAMSPHEAAEVEVKQQEKQRLLGVLPNFGITYNWHAPPLDTKQKFELATRTVIDPLSLAINAGIVTGEIWSGKYKEFGTGASGFGYLYGVTMADNVIGTELGGAILPSLFHQDPRYFWKGTGTVKSRVFYALSRAVICRGDNGKEQFSWSGVGGDLGAGAFSNLYYPAQDRHGAALTLENGGLSMAADALNNVVQEFLFKHLTPSARKKSSNAPGSENDKP
jgi:hypothetical protein